MNEKICPKFEKCVIFQEGVLYSGQTGQTYKNLFCQQPEKYPICKRYIVSEKTGLSIPANIMPNSKLSIDEIIEKLKK